MRNRNTRLIIILLPLLALLLDSCSTLNRSRMLKAPYDYEFSQFPDSTNQEPYKISSDDILQVALFSNNGFKPIFIGFGGGMMQNAGNNIMRNGGITNGTMNMNGRQQNMNMNGQQQFGMQYRVLYDGYVKIPVLGRFHVAGLTVQEAEKLFESKLEKYYKDAFVILTVTNRRVYLFQGGNTAQVVNLPNDNTTLFEVLATVGGISFESNAKKIKIIRGDLKDPNVYQIDLSRLENLTESDLIMQANDIIYVDPVINIASNITSDISVILSLVASVLLIINLRPTP